MKTVFIIACTFLILEDMSFCMEANDISAYFWHLSEQAKYVRRVDLDQSNWREIRKYRNSYKNARQDSKKLSLRVLGASPNIEQATLPEKEALTPAIAMIIDPEGTYTEYPDLSSSEGEIDLPPDKNLTGRYLLGAHIPLGKRDVDGDGILESVHYYAKHIFSHHKNGGQRGSKSIVFFDDDKNMPLEIGPDINTAKSRYGGSTQRPHRVYTMMVKYMNHPLPGATVTVTAEGSGWQKSFVTDDNGKFDVLPTDDRVKTKGWQRYLYMTTHHDKTNHSYHVATFPVVVYGNSPEWLSKTMGFTYWAITGCFLTVLLVMFLVKHQNRQKNRELIIFESYKIRREEE